MQQLTPVDPELFISNRLQLQSYKCAFCFQLSPNMRKCAGSCQKNICTTCLRLFLMRNRCPICKDKIQIENAIIPAIRFVCPSFNPQCGTVEFSRQEFFLHASTCPFISEQQQAQFRHKSNYQCQCSGALRVYDDERTCHECNQISSCSKCTNCSKKYCLQCRRPPVSKHFCARGHRFTKEIAQENDTICDLCELPIYNLKLRTKYVDQQCEFDVCYICIEALPEVPTLPFLEDSSGDDYSQSSDQEDSEEESEDSERQLVDNDEEEEEGDCDQQEWVDQQVGSDVDESDEAELEEQLNGERQNG